MKDVFCLLSLRPDEQKEIAAVTCRVCETSTLVAMQVALPVGQRMLGIIHYIDLKMNIYLCQPSQGRNYTMAAKVHHRVSATYCLMSGNESHTHI